jgi:hypothetical protein
VDEVATTSDPMWADRVDQLERDLVRVSALLDELGQWNPSLSGRFGRLLSALREDQLGPLRQAAAVGALAPDLWKRLSTAHTACRQVFDMQLELLGGAAIREGIDQAGAGFDGGFAARAEGWLDGLRRGAGLRQELAVIPGLGPVLERTTGVVRAPFLDFDLWTLPLLARALGLVAADEDRERAGGRFEKTARLLAPMVRELRQPDGGPAGWEQAWLEHAFADMFATAVIGPVYALAVFALELDFIGPERYGLADPEQVEDRELASRYLPSPVQRAATILATLDAMDRDPARAWHQEGPYSAIVVRLRDLWRDAGGGAELLQATSDSLATWHALLFDEVLRHQLADRLPATAQAWRETVAAHQAWRTASNSGAGGRTWATADGTPDSRLLGVIWLYRLDVPDQDEELLTVAERALQGMPSPLAQPSGTLPVAAALARFRLIRLVRRWERLEAALGDQRLPRSGRAAVTGRLYRLLSERIHDQQRVTATLGPAPAVPSAWQELAPLEEEGRPLRREALEFLGGVLISERCLDREPASPLGPGKGPSIGDLADRMLRDCAHRTGVNWSAGTVPGKDPFLETTTDLIRVRFPDWSVWNLPLMAHEFGHLVARATPAFTRHQRRCGPTATVRRHLEEVFADAFATYTLGPAFACDMILLQLNPGEAHQPRSRHPTHHERVQVILQMLEQMNDWTRARPTDQGRFRSVVDELRRRWTLSVQAAGGGQADTERLGEVRRWVAALIPMIDRCYRLGAGYPEARWEWAHKAAAGLWPAPPGLEALRAGARADGLDDVRLGDLLNLVWAARLDRPEQQAFLTEVALTLGRDYQRAGE